MVIAAHHGITPEGPADHFTAVHDQTYPVILTTKDKEDGSGKNWNTKAPSRRLPFDHADESNRPAEEVRDLNAFLQEQTYEPPIAPRFVATSTRTQRLRRNS